MIAYILIGYPGSGKSTWAKKQKAAIINRDSIRTMIYGKYDYRHEDEILVYEMAEACAWAAMNHERDVVIDDTNLPLKTRAKWIETFKRMKYRVVFVVFNTDLRTCIARRSIESKGFNPSYWEKVITNMQNIYCEPKLGEGADEIIIA